MIHLHIDVLMCLYNDTLTYQQLQVRLWHIRISTGFGVGLGLGLGLGIGLETGLGLGLGLRLILDE